LWGGPSFWQQLTGIDNHAPDHVLVVSGLDFSDPQHPQVFLNDPGTPSGSPEVYSLDQFLQAWDDSNFFYCATDFAPTDLQNDGTGFYTDTGIYGTIDDWVNLFTSIGWEAAAIATVGILGLSAAAAEKSLWKTAEQKGVFG
jgi:hypothetical protein